MVEIYEIWQSTADRPQCLIMLPTEDKKYVFIQIYNIEHKAISGG